MTRLQQILQGLSDAEKVELAAALGVNRVTVYRWANGDAPRKKSAAALVTRFGSMGLDYNGIYNAQDTGNP